MYAMLDFEDLRIEKRTEYSKIKSFYMGEEIENYQNVCDKKYADSIDDFFNGNIKDSAFSECIKLKNIIIPKDVANIGIEAFKDCRSLVNVKITKGVISIGNFAFFGCNRITSVEIPSSVTSIGHFAFWKCDNLKSAIFEITSGWQVWDKVYKQVYVITSSELENIPTAVKSLIETYRQFHWTRII